MRIAFSGAHGTGKTTLVEAVASDYPAYDVFEEPYRLLEEDGYEFNDPPSVEDFEQQLRRSLELVASAPRNALLDRCPIDFIAYLTAIELDFDVEPWLDELRDSVTSLDLIVLVPIETPDRIPVTASEDRHLRRRVDELLNHLVLNDPYGFAVRTLEIRGGLHERVSQVRGAIAP